jgi:hypothetical protein
MWPTFIAVTLLDGLILHLLPPIGTGVDLIPGILIATFANLFLVGAVAPWLARRVKERQAAAGQTTVPRQAMREVTADRIGTVLLAVGFFGVLASGLASIPLINGETDARNRAAKALVTYVDAHAPTQIQRTADEGAVETERLADGYFRSCVPFADRRRYWCVFIDTNRHPTRVLKDRSEEPNQRPLVR